MDAYFAAKARLFETLLPEDGTAVVNADSDRAAQLGEICARRGLRFWTYGTKGREFRLVRDEPTPRGQHLVVEVLGTRHEVELPLVGGFQASNALAALGLVVATGGDVARAVAALATLTRRAGPAAARGAPQDGRAGLCRLRPQARGAGDGAGDPAAVRQGQAGRGVRLRRRPRPRQAAGDGRDRHAPRRLHAGDRRQSAQRGTRRDPRRDRRAASRSGGATGSRCADRHAAIEQGMAALLGRRPAADRRQGPRDRPDHQGRDPSISTTPKWRGSSRRDRPLDLRRGRARSVAGRDVGAVRGTGVTFDSRAVARATSSSRSPGESTDGHAFVADACRAARRRPSCRATCRARRASSSASPTR